ncbi:MAG TPA: TetR family transcriptional regulator [Steroidobacteraceae bacterium]|nr:TetR family transcriptional regulator [Steroidobacteraceae bacterium]
MKAEPAAAARSRAPKQERSAQRQRLIAEAAIAVIADHGIASVTHRRVAERAGVSLAATTYYYKTKADIIAVASAQLLAGYVDAFRRVAERHRAEPGTSVRDLVSRLVINATGKYRTGTLAWCEIILDGARHQDTRTLARAWFARLFEIWSQIARVHELDAPEDVARSAIDMIIGLLLIVIPLGLKESQITAVLRDGADPHEAWKVRGAKASDRGGVTEEPARKARKSEQTRERILAAALELLKTDGAGGVTFSAIAKQAGVSPTAPIYYYSSIESLLQAAQVRLFENSKERYRQVMAGVDVKSIDIDRVADLTATVFVREATEFGLVSLADFPVRLAAARHHSLRPTVWGVIDAQTQAWSRLLRPLTDRPRALDGLLMQALFVGKLVRLLAIGATTSDLVNVRKEFLYDLRALARGRHWSAAPVKLVRKLKNN